MPDAPVLSVERLYRDRFSAADQAAKARIWKVLCADFFGRFVAPADTVLDLACGHGEFINSIRCGQRLALDINGEARAYLAPEVRFSQQSCEDLSGIAGASVDVVFESNLFEHLRDKEAVASVVRQVYRVLRSGGRFILMQPNIKYVGADYWDFYDHIVPLSHLSCVELLRNCGFRMRRVIPRFLPYTTKSGLPQHPLLVKLYLKCPLAWRVLGKQFVIVAEK